MAENEIAVKLVLDNQLQEQLKAAYSNAEKQTNKMKSSMDGLGDTAAKKVAGDFTTMDKEAKASLSRTGEEFGRLSGKAQMFGQNLVSGNVGGAIRSFVELAVDGFKTVGLSAAVATGGISLAVGAAAILIQQVVRQHEELKKLQEEAARATVDQQKLMDQQILDETERALAERLTKQLDDLDASDAISDKRIEKVRAELKELGELTAFSSENKIREYYALQKEELRLEQEKADNAEKIQERYYKDVAEIKKKNAVETEGSESKKDIFDPASFDKGAVAIAAFYKKLDDDKKKQFDEGQARLKIETTEKQRMADLEIENNNMIKQSIEDKRIAEIAYQEAVMYGTANMIGAFAGLNSALKGNAETSKMLARGSVIIDTAAAIMKNFALTGPLAFVTNAAIVATGITQLARIDAQKFALGGDFVTSGPQMIMVGDNPGGRERVQVTPMSSQNYNGPQGGGAITMGDIIINGNADAGTVKALNVSREKQLRDLRRMLMELSYARQMPSFS